VTQKSLVGKAEVQAKKISANSAIIFPREFSRHAWQHGRDGLVSSEHAEICRQKMNSSCCTRPGKDFLIPFTTRPQTTKRQIFTSVHS
jgi:hypothetical protein